MMLMTQARRSNLIVLLVILTFVLTGSQPVLAQSEVPLEERVEKLEQYAATIQPNMVELSQNINSSMQEYTKGLEASLEAYSLKLQASLDERLNNVSRNVAILNPYSTAYQTIESNTGTFLISVEKNEALDNGARLHLNIGNPNFADYQNFRLRLIWGARYPGKSVMSYSDWRQTLQGADFSFEGKIEKGKWNAITVDLVPSDRNSLAYIECEMTVSSVELGYN